MSNDEKIVQLLERIINRANNAKNTSNIDRIPSIIRLAKQGIEILDATNKILNE